MILHGDSLHILKTLEENSVDSIVTDPPYGLKFMGKKWDYEVPSVELWREALRVLKPGGHLLSFGGTRTYHRMVVNMEDAGFEIRDQIMWIYGSGFPKSQDVSKAIDKQAGVEREVVGSIKKTQSYGEDVNSVFGSGPDKNGVQNITAPATDAAKQWSGWGTALKPANEPIVMARKPLETKLTVAANVLKYGTGGINIDESRIGFSSQADFDKVINPTLKTEKGYKHTSGAMTGGINRIDAGNPQGRWPANILFDEQAAQVLDEQAEGASRFFYVAKASKSERNKGLEGMPLKERAGVNKMMGSNDNNSMLTGSGNKRDNLNQNHHPTVKPIKLMEYLVTLITPPGGTVLDPFTGSGSTLVAAKCLGFKFIGIELNGEYKEIAERRTEAHA